MSTIKRICIRDTNGLKFGDTFECNLDTSHFGTRISSINGKEVNTWITVTDLNKFSVELQDMRDLKLTLLVGSHKANKRLKKKIQTAFKMNDYSSIIKLSDYPFAENQIKLLSKNN